MKTKSPVNRPCKGCIYREDCKTKFANLECHYFPDIENPIFDRIRNA